MKSKIKNTLVSILASLSILFLLTPVFVSAAVANGSPPIEIKNPASGLGNDLLEAVTNILEKIILPIGAVLCVIWIIYAGLSFVLAQGKPAEIEKAKQRLLWALIGTGILLGAVGISKAVKLTVDALFTP